MIEVERKFRVTAAQKESLTRSATLQRQVENTDQYFDFDDLRLMKSDCWLRKRNNTWELKITRDSNFATRRADIYDELTRKEDIQRHLGLDLAEAIHQKLLRSWAHLQTSRAHYEANDYSLDFDDIRSLEDDFTYQLMEIEIMVVSPEQIDDATQRILTLATQHGLDLERPLGKVLAYFHERKPSVFDQLNAAWSAT